MDRPPRPDFSWLRLPDGEMPAEEIQRIDDAASRPTDEQGAAAGDAVAQPGMALELTPPALRAVWGVVTGPYTAEGWPVPALYRFAQIAHQGNQPALVEGGIDAVALEVMGSADVPTGAVCVFWPSEDDLAGAAAEKWRFRHANPHSLTLPQPDPFGSGSGDGDCDVNVNGTGTICLGPGITIVINGLLIFGNYFEFTVVTNVCPVFTQIALVGGGTLDVQTGTVVEHRTLRLPRGLYVSNPFCELDPDSCCESGSGADNTCCLPRPPDVLWAARLASDVSHLCMDDCVRLDYDPTRDAWYSAVIDGDCPDAAGAYYFRVRCRAGLWAWDVVDAADEVVIAGEVSSDNCDPFLLAAHFADTGASIAAGGGAFDYWISEVDCSLSGSGGAVQTDCCEPTINAKLYACVSEKTGTCDCLDDGIAYAMDHDDTSEVPTWSHNELLCGGTDLWVFHCIAVEGGGEFQLSGPIGDPIGDFPVLLSVQCEPLLCVFQVNDLGRLGCSYKLTISDVPCGDASNECCDEPLPAELTMVVSGHGACECMSASIPMTFDGTATWASGQTPVCADFFAVATLQCMEDGSLRAVLYCANGGWAAELAVGGDCTLPLVFGVMTPFNNVCCPGGTIEVTITA